VQPLRRYRVELLLTLLCVAVLAGFVAMQHILLAQPATLTGETTANYTGLIAAPLDDVYIHCRYAMNLLAGNGYAFNPDVPVTGDTSPLWVALIAIGGLVTRHLDLAAICISILCYILLSIGVYRATRDLYGMPPTMAVLAGVLTVLSSRLVWSGVSGMETALAALLMFLSLEEHERCVQRGRIRWREGLWLGLGIATRPEFLFVAAVLLLDWLTKIAIVKADKRSTIAAAAVALILGSPSVLLPLAIEGHLLSHSSIVQGAGLHYIPDFGYLLFAAKILASNNIAIALLIVAGVALLYNTARYRILLIVAIGLPVLQAFVAPQFRHHGRYFFPVIPLLIICGMAAMNNWRDKGRIAKPLFLVLIAALILSGAVETTRWSYLEAASVRNINDQHLAAASFVRDSIPPSETIAADDVGALGYYANRPVLDLTGLISPEMYPLQLDQRSVWRHAREEGARVFLIYNRLNPQFYSSCKDSLTLIREFRIRKPLVAAADTVMSLYRIRNAD
jgi:hypothetical protein